MSAFAGMAALGSSFAAGPGIRPMADRGAGRSQRNYPHLVAEALSIELTDATVSGATTETILRSPQRLGLRTFAPQIESLRSDTDLVTVTVGGNDLGYLAGMIGASYAAWLRGIPLAGRLVRSRPTAPEPVSPDKVETMTQGLAAIVDDVRHRAPGARVVLVDYLTILGAASVTGPRLPLSAAQIEHFRGVGETVSRAFEDAAARTGAELVRASTISADHALGAAEPWVAGFSARLGGPASYHPNFAGMRAVADAILALLR